MIEFDDGRFRGQILLHYGLCSASRRSRSPYMVMK